MKFKGIGQAPNKFGVADVEKVKEFLARPDNRSKRRLLGGIQLAPSDTARPRARACKLKPVKRQDQLLIEQRRAARQQLLKIKLYRLLPECPELKFVLGTHGLTSIWKLARASNEIINNIPDLGQKRREKIHAYLTGKNVPVAWKA